MALNNLQLVSDTTLNDGDKEKALDAAISQIERSFGKGSIMKLGQQGKAVDVETVSTGSLGLDIGLGIGGLPRGRIVEIYGPESSGKTTLALHVIAEAQKAGGTCAFVDAEHAHLRYVDGLYGNQSPLHKPLERGNDHVEYCRGQQVASGLVVQSGQLPYQGVYNSVASCSRS